YSGEGYEIAGFAWHQGYNDRVTPAYSAEYQTNMANFINDIRSSEHGFGVPNLPFVIATTGMDGGPAYTTVEQAQLKMADATAYPGFDGNVRVVDVRGVYDGLDFWQPVALSPADQGYHWNRNAKTYLHIGMAMGDAMSLLVKPRGPYRLRATGGAPGVTLNWQNGTEIPTNVQILRDGVEIAASTPADPPTFTDTTATPGVHDYQLVFTMPVAPSPPLNVNFDAGITGLSAFRIPGGVYLTWTNNLGYSAIEVRRNGVLIAPSHSGTATTYVDGSPPASGLVTYTVVPSTGSSTPATVQINLSAAPSGNAVIYEPFDYPDGGLNGNGGAEVGLTGTWTATSSNVQMASGSLAYGSLPTYGKSVSAIAGQNTFGGSRSVTAAALSGSGLLNDGATLWFSMVMGYGTGGNLTNARLAFALGNSSFGTGNAQYFIVNEGSQPGSGLGVTLGRFSTNGWTVATQFRDASFGTSLFGGNVFGTVGGTTIGAGQQRLVIGKITWGESGDTIELYQPDANLNLGSAVSTLTADVDQSTFDTLTFTRGDVVTLDEIRFGANLEDVIGASTPAAYWDLDGTTPGSGGVDGNKPSGTWDTGSQWNPVFIGSASTAPWSAGDKAVFSAGTNASGTYSVTVAGTRDIGGLAVEEGTANLSGGTALRLTKDATLDVKPGLTASIATPLTEDAAGRSLSKEGAGTLLISGSNSYSGPTNLFNGILQPSSPASLPGYTSAAKVVFKGGTLGVPVGGGWTTGQVDTLLANATKSSGALGIDTTAGSLAQWTPFTSVLGLTKLGGNTFTLDQANTFTGVTTVKGGTLALAHNLALQNSTLNTDLGGAATMAGMATPTFGGVSGSGDLSFVIGGYGGVSSLTLNPPSGKLAIYKGIIANGVAPMPLSKTGAGAQVLLGTNTYGGTTTVSAGTLTVGGSDGSITNSAGIVLDGGLLLLDSATGGNGNRIKDTANVTLSLGGELRLTGGTTSLTETFANLRIIGNSTFTAKQGTAGAMATLAGASFTRTGKATALVRGTALGQNTTQMGKVTFADPSGFSFVGTSVLDNAANSDTTKTVSIIPYFLGGSNDLEAGSTFITYDTTLGLRALNTSNHFTTLSAGYVTPGTPENVKSFNGTITAASPVINSLLFSSANQTLAGSGTLTIESGAIAVAANNEIISGFSGVTLGNGTWNEGVIHVTGNQLTINPPVTVTGGGGLTKGGSNLLILAAPIYAGDTTVNAGNLQINAANANNDTSSVQIYNGAKFILNFSGTDTVQKLYINGSRVPNGVYGRSSADSTALGINAYFGTSGSGTLTVSDAVAPILAARAIVDDKGGAPVIVNTLVTYTVTFGDEMDGSTVTAADFGNAGTSVITFGSVTQVSPDVFTVQVTPTTAGTLQLRVNAGADLRDFVGNALVTTSAIADDTTLAVNDTATSYETWSGGATFNDDANGDG
ncbi:MAG TPA: autotransporter-associated beta strand repeat-containing protein, partial [Verrucomicrobiae bacterium]|nr:autotransporter-associated beta strand repeat-containing protein [Verrucomicrobiae bacterium]